MLPGGRQRALPAIMTIHPGRGRNRIAGLGEMLMRMYLRWAERNNFGIVITDRLEGEGAGIKSVSVWKSTAQRLWPLQSKSGRAPAGPHLALRCQRAAPYLVASVFVYPQIDDEIKIDYQAGRSAHRYLQGGRRGRAARQL